MDLSTIPAPAWVVIGSAVTGLITLATSWIQGKVAIRTADKAAQGQIEAVRAEAHAVRQRDSAEARRQDERTRLDEILGHAETVTSNFIWLTRSWEVSAGMIPNDERHAAMRQIQVGLTKLRLRAPDMELPESHAAFSLIDMALDGGAANDFDHPWFKEYLDEMEKSVAEYVQSATAAVTTELETAPNDYPTETLERSQTSRND